MNRIKLSFYYLYSIVSDTVFNLKSLVNMEG